MVNRIRDGKYEEIDPEKFSTEDLKRFYANIEDALRQIEANNPDQMHQARKDYVTKLEAIIQKSEQEGKSWQANLARKDQKAITSDTEYIQRETGQAAR